MQNEQHNVLAKWQTEFGGNLAKYFFKVENEKYVWVFLTPTQTDQHIKLAIHYNGPVYTLEQLIENEKNTSPDTYQMVCEFFSTILDGTAKPYWTNELSSALCECGSEAVYGLHTTHVNWCPKA